MLASQPDNLGTEMGEAMLVVAFGDTVGTMSAITAGGNHRRGC
jgi:hypothetical protein